MISVLGLALLVTAMPSPQAEYDATIALFEKLPYICGSIVASGGPVQQPTVSTFRLWPGGRYDVFFANRDEHSDGKQVFTYSPEVNKYIMSPARTTHFGVLFGPRFDPAGSLKAAVESVRDSTYDGRAARVFRLKQDRGEGPSELFVRKDNGQPLALMHYGQQASYATAVPELHLDRKAEFRLWVPPKGSVATDFLPGE